MHPLPNRREALALAGGALLTGMVRAAPEERGRVVGAVRGAKAGADVLAAGGNAVDAIVAAALVAAVADVHQCGIGGYGGHMVLAYGGGRRETAIDFNSAAPQAARDNLFPLDADGRVK